MRHAIPLRSVTLAILLLAVSASAGRAAELPVLFVHGFCADSSKFDGLIAELQRERDPSSRFGYGVSHFFFDGNQVKQRNADGRGSIIPTSEIGFEPTRRLFTIDFFNPTADGDGFNNERVADVPIEFKAHELRSVIQEIKRITRAPAVVVVSHSMGGLVARAYVEGFASSSGDAGNIQPFLGDVSGIMTLDTPHRGSLLTKPPTLEDSRFLSCVYEGSVTKEQLRPDTDPRSPLLPRLNRVPIPGNVSLLLLVSYGWLAPESGDGIVSFGSQDLTSLSLYAEQPNVRRVLNPNDAWPFQMHSDIVSQPFVMSAVRLFVREADQASPAPPPPSGPPGKPTLSITTAGTTVSGRWSPGPGGPADSFIVQVGSTRGSSDIFNQNVGLALSGSGVLPPGTYYARAIAQNVAGSATSDEVVFTVAGGSPGPTSIQLRSVTPSSGTTGILDMTLDGSGFDPLSAVDQVFWKATGQLVGSGNILSRSATRIVVRQNLATAQPGVYQIRVRNGNGALSNPVDFTVEGGTSNPTNDYPFKTSPCSDFSETGTDPWRFYYRQCTSFVAWRMNRDAGVTATNLPLAQYPFSNDMQGRLRGVTSSRCPTRGGRLSDAECWAEQLAAIGYRVDQSPAVGSIAHWTAEEINFPAGHVAYVASVNPDGSVIVEEYNRTACEYTRRQTRAPRYIHFNGAQTPGSAPIIEGLDPAQLAAGPGDRPLRIVGRGFADGLSVVATFPGGQITLPGAAIRAVTATTVDLLVTLANPGDYSLRVSNPGGRSSNTWSFAVTAGTNPSPRITGLNPTSLVASPTGRPLRVLGESFRAPVRVFATYPGGSVELPPAAIASVTGSAVDLLVTLANTGDYSLRIVNADGQSSNAWAFAVTSGAPPPPPPPPTPSPIVPVINSILPTAPIAGPGNQVVTVFGANFQSGLTVFTSYPGGSTILSGAQIQNVTATTIQLVVTLANPGSYAIRVINPNGIESNTFGFSVNTPPTPISPLIAGISPNPLTASSGNQTVTVAGSGFQAGLTVLVSWAGGSSTLSGSQIQNVNGTSFQMLVTVANAGVYGIRVNNPGGQQSNTFSFTVNPAPPAPVQPTINSISPNPLTASSANQTVTVFGNGFQAGLTVLVTWAGGSSTLSGSQIQSVGATSFQMLITVASAGAYAIRVNSPSGSQSAPFAFSVNAAPPPSVPSIASISPSTPTASGANQTVTVFGSNFQPGLTVLVTWAGGSSTLSGSQIQNVTGASFQMVITLASAGTYGIRVNNPGGAQSTTFNFTVASAPTPPSINGISPNTPTASGSNQTVSVFGSGFQPGLTVLVTWSGGSSTLSGSQIQNVNGSSFQMIITLANAGAYAIRVTNPGGLQSGTFGFNVGAAPSPSIGSISPATPTRSSVDQTVNVFGANFQAGLTVSITYPGGSGVLSGTQIRNVTGGSFQLIVTLGGPGTWSIRVNNPDGRQSNTFTFTVN